MWLEWETTITIKAVETGGIQIVLDLNDDTFRIDNDPLYFVGDQIYVKRGEVEAQQSVLQDQFKDIEKLAPAGYCEKTA